MLNKIKVTDIKWDSNDTTLETTKIIDPLKLIEQLTVDEVWDLIYEYLTVHCDIETNGDIVNFDWEWI